MTTEPSGERVLPVCPAIESRGEARSEAEIIGPHLSRDEALQRLEKREAMLRATSFAASQFMAVPWQKSLEPALRALGEAIGCARVWVVEQNDGSEKAPREWQWAVPRERDESIKQVWDERDWHLISASGSVVQLARRDLEASAKDANVEDANAEANADETDFALDFATKIGNDFLDARCALSLAAAPIRSENEVWGYIGFDECRAPRVWDEAEIEVLQILGDILGVAVARDSADAALRESETELRTSEAELRALLNAMRDVILVIDRDGIYTKVFANDPTILIWPALTLVGKTLEEVIGDQGREFLDLVREVLNTGEVRALEYSLTIEGEICWFSASVTPLGEDTVLWVARDVTATRQAAESLRESEALFRLLAENSTDKIARMALDGTFLYVSPSVQPLLGYAPEEIVGVNPFSMIHPDDRATVAASFERIYNTPGHTDLIAYRMQQRSGDYVWFETTSRLVYEKDGLPSEIHSVSRDISARRAAEDALREAETKYRSIFENAVEGIFQTSPDGCYLNANPSLWRIYGYESLTEIQANVGDISNQLYIEPRRRLEFIAEMEKHGFVTAFEAKAQRKDGQIIWISENAREVRDEGGALLYYEGTVEDITARKNAEEQLLHDAFHDKLTGLTNRALFMDRLGQAFSRLKRHPEEPFAALFLDFDRFKNVNDSLGHMAGDQLLIAVSARIADCLRPLDTVSRLGGDEFAVLLPDVIDVAGAILAAERIQSAMSAPFRLAGQEIFTSASIGIAMGDPNYDHPEELLRDADMAMYRAKALGKARHHVFDAGMHKRAVALLQLETDLRHAIEREEFRVVYQPIVTLESGIIDGFEALVRWQHPTRGVISPADFIPVAEETGWIVPIGRWVLEEACRQLAEWHAQTGDVSLSMSVNLSTKQFAQPNLLLEIENVLRDHGLPPATLRLEITESALMERAEEITDRLFELRALGVKLSLDDFGTGYSSLSYLHRFPLETLKIDRSFIARMSDGDGENREIVRTIVALGRNLGLNVVAEGVEEAEQLRELRELGCNSGQGYFFARPLSASDALEMLRGALVW